MKIIREGLDLNSEPEILHDAETEYGLLYIELGDMRFCLQDRDGALYLNMTCKKGVDRMRIYPHAANAITLIGDNQ